MAYTTVRISEETRAVLRELAQGERVSMQAILVRAIDAYRRQRFFDRADEAYRNLEADPEALEHYRDEIQAWEATLADGLQGAGTTARGGARSKGRKRQDASR